MSYDLHILAIRKPETHSNSAADAITRRAWTIRLIDRGRPK
jgi:hypothetical protein